MTHMGNLMRHHTTHLVTIEHPWQALGHTHDSRSLVATGSERIRLSIR